MPRKKMLVGEMVSCDEPVWQPLLDLAAKIADDFMLMFAVDLEDGRRIYAYKHWWTRRYVYVGADGKVFGYTAGDRYVECNPTWLLGQVMAADPELTRWRDWRDPE